MTEDDPLLSSPLDASIRQAHEALRALAGPEHVGAAGNRYLPSLVEELPYLADLVRASAAGDLGPTIVWERSAEVTDKWGPVILQLDLDGLTDEDPAGVSHVPDWDQSALALAARAYRQDCGWDFTPDESGKWLVCVMPYDSVGKVWRGIVAGFAIVHDRDGDGRYEALAHLWTAAAWRRRGVGRTLLEEIQKRFPVRYAEGPVTTSGQQALASGAPRLVSGH